jgi:hypothetical protein
LTGFFPFTISGLSSESTKISSAAVLKDNVLLAFAGQERAIVSDQLARNSVRSA